MKIPTEASLTDIVSASAKVMLNRSIGIPLAKQAASLKITRFDVPTVLEVEVSGNVPRIPLEDGALPEMIQVVRNGEPVGTLMFWLGDGLLESVEFSWFFETRPDRWPEPNELEAVGS